MLIFKNRTRGTEMKYKKDDILINKIFEAEPLSTINFFVVNGVEDDKYICKSQEEPSIEIPRDEIEDEFVSITEVYWYFEIYDFIKQRWSSTNTRMTIQEMAVEYGPYHDTLKWEPDLARGFRLKEQI